MKCGIITLIGPDQESAYQVCSASIQLAIQTSSGPFRFVETIPIFDPYCNFTVAKGRDVGLQKALELGCDWVFFLDPTDVVFVDAFQSVSQLVNEFDAIWGLVCEASDANLTDARILPNQWPQSARLEDILMASPDLPMKTAFFMNTNLTKFYQSFIDFGEEDSFYFSLWKQFKCIKCNSILFVKIAPENLIGLRALDSRGLRPSSTRESDLNVPISRKEIDSLELIERGRSLLFTVGTLVNDLKQYDLMIQSYGSKGFSNINSEFIFVDNCVSNKLNAYESLNRILNSANGKYIIICHQDVRLHADNIEVLISRLEQLGKIDDKWAIAGNAGGGSEGLKAQRISDPHGFNRSIGTFPCRVSSLDENFIILRKDNRVALSNNIGGFHFYGTDICLIADILGYSSYVIDFHLMHLGAGKIDSSFFHVKKSFERKWSDAFRPRTIQTSCTIVDIETSSEVKPQWMKSASQKESQIFQIFYDEKTRSMVAPEFIPLDNMENVRPDWFEFHVIRRTLATLKMQEDCFYGFLSTNFSFKTGMSPSEVHNLIKSIPRHVEVILLTSKAHELVQHRNIFLQGEFHHRGLLSASEFFFEYIGAPINLKHLVTSLENSVASNYIIAKPRFWRQWLKIADNFFDYVEKQKYNKISALESPTAYKGRHDTELKVFIQERLATFLLVTQKFETYVPNHFKKFKMYDDDTRVGLRFLENLKDAFINTGNTFYIDEYERVLSNGGVDFDNRILNISYLSESSR